MKCAQLVLEMMFLLLLVSAQARLVYRQLTSDFPPEYEYIGCFREQLPSRALPVHYLTISANPGAVITDCARAAVAKGFVIFGVQNGNDCWGGEGRVAYERYVSSTQCEFGDVGPLLMSVYRITKVDGYCVVKNSLYQHGEPIKTDDMDDPCQSCSCTYGGRLECYKNRCPPVDSYCQKTFTLPGTCCKACACYHNNRAYSNGDRWQLIDGSNCFSCTCVNDKPVCVIPVCPTCQSYVQVSGQCCRACAPVTITISETTTPKLTLPPPQEDRH
ncbi:uncharacterized protein LOC116620028 [Nematostella vectensis]|uniref:uncharacterized protein LOC116620028 n=1 Tax=Nematostella vectensis TaxID=45351 RepID=UPI0020776557|nr:uncharacterized protein LOC116620028 [Nematostella vectensis]